LDAILITETGLTVNWRSITKQDNPD